MKTYDQIKAGLDNQEFYFEYMPTISLNDGKCCGAEALLRWQHNDERVSPDEFISTAENTPLSGLITGWVLEEVSRDLGEWLGAVDNVHIGINIPPDSIGRGFLQYAAEKAGLIPVADKLLLEITERGFPDQQALDALLLRGKTKLAIDDFGTGDANLYQLSQMDADIIKMDKIFVDQIKDQTPPKIVKAIIAYALALECEIIAEGVESDFQVEALKSLGVHMAQGWYFSKSLRVKDFIAFYESHGIH